MYCANTSVYLLSGNVVIISVLCALFVVLISKWLVHLACQLTRCEVTSKYFESLRYLIVGASQWLCARVSRLDT